MNRTLLTASITIATTLSLGLAQGQDGLPLPENDRALERELTERVRAAYEAESFEARNRASAEAIKHEVALEANRALGFTGGHRQAEIERIVGAATLKAGQAFNGGGGASAAGGIALRALGPTLQQVEPGLEQLPRVAARTAEAAVSRSTIDDVARIVARDLGLKEPPLRGHQLIETIDRVVPEKDYFRKDIPNLRVRRPGQRPLNEQELRTLGLGTRLANATWKAGQVHRAFEAGNLERITPAPGSPWSTFDTHKRALYQHAWNEYYDKAWEHYDRNARVPEGRGGGIDGSIRASAQRIAFARVVFEVWKDVIELKKAVAESRANPEARARHLEERAAFQRQLAEERAAELRGLSVPQLVARAKARGLDVQPGMSKAEIVARLSGSKAGEAGTVKASAAKAEGKGFAEMLDRVGQRARGKGGRRGR
jgi:hypothetical protein